MPGTLILVGLDEGLGPLGGQALRESRALVVGEEFRFRSVSRRRVAPLRLRCCGVPKRQLVLGSADELVVTTVLKIVSYVHLKMPWVNRRCL